MLCPARTSRPLTKIALFAGLCASSAAAAATEARWLAPISGMWHDPSRWTTAPFPPINGAPPGAIYDAVIDAHGAPYTVEQLGDNFSALSLLLNSSDATLVVTDGAFATPHATISAGACVVGNGGSFQAGAAEIAGALEARGIGAGIRPLLRFDSTALVSGQLLVGSGGVQGNGSISVAAQGALVIGPNLGASIASFALPVDVLGALRVGGAGQFLLPVHVNSPGRLEIVTTAAAGASGNFFGGIQNDGVITKSGAGVGILGAQLGQGPPLGAQAGTVNVDAGTLRLSGWTHTGTCAIAANATLELVGPNVFAPSARVIGEGELVLGSGSQFMLSNATLAPTLGLRVVAGLLTCADPVSLRAIDIDGGGFHLGADLSITESLSFSGQGVLSGPGRFVVGPQAASDLSDARLELQGGALLDLRADTASINYGWFTFYPDAAVHSAALWTVRIGLSPSFFRLEALEGGGALLNEGIIRKEGIGLLSIEGHDGSHSGPNHPQPGFLIDGGGAFDVREGSLRFDQVEWRSGSISLAAGTSLQFIGVAQAEAQITGAGSVDILGYPFRGHAAISGDMALSGRIEASVLAGSLRFVSNCVLPPGVVAQCAGAISLDGDYNAPNLTLSLAGREQTPGSHSRVVAGGQASLNRRVDVVLSEGFQPSPGDAWTLLEFGSRTSALPTLTLPPFEYQLWKWWRELDQTHLRIGVRLAPDLNHDSRVDFLDLSLVLGNFGAYTSEDWPNPGDANLDHHVDFIDLNLVLYSFGVAPYGIGPKSSIVP